VRLAKLSEFRRLVYSPGSAPHLDTLRAHIADIPGGRIEFGRYYVDLDEYDRQTNMRQATDTRRAQLSKDP
jgi:hypothetical protein